MDPRSNQPMDRCVATMPLGLAYVLDGRIADINPAGCELMGARPDQIIGRSFLELVDPADREMVSQRHRARLAGEAAPDSYEVRHVRIDGRSILVEVSPRVIGPREMVVLLRDVTDHVRDSALVVALTEIAARIQRCRDVDAVLDVAGRGLMALGMRVSTVQCLEHDYVLRHVAMSPEVLAGFEASIGQPMLGLRFTQNPDAWLAPILERRRAEYHDDLRPLVEMFFSNLGAPAADSELLRGADRGRIVMAPLIVHDRPWGVLCVMSPMLSAADAAAIGLFASQIASTMEVIESLDDLERTHGDLAAIHAVAQATEEQDLGGHLPRLAEIAASATTSDLCVLYLFDEETSEFHLGACYGSGSERDAIPNRLTLSDSLTGRVALSTRSRALLPADQGEETSDHLGPLGRRHWAIIPLQIKGRLVGAMNLGRREDRPYRDAELHLATLLGAQLAIQAENARLYAEAHRRVRLLSVLFSLGRMGSEASEMGSLVDRVVALVASALAADGAMLHLVRDNRLVLMGARPTRELPAELQRLPLDDTTPMGRAALGRKTLLEDASASRIPELGEGHFAAVPLVASDRLVGVLSMTRRADRPFLDEETRLLEASATQAAIALEHTHLFEQARQRVDELRLLLDVGRAITASLDLEVILEQAAVILTRLIDASNCFILLVEEGTRHLRGVASAQPEWREQLKAIRISMDEPSIAVRSVRTGSAVAIADVSRTEDVNLKLVQLFGEKSLLAIPIKARDQTIGCVMIDDTRRIRDWTEAEIERATLISSQVGAAIVNARLYEDLKRSYAELAKAQEELVKRERLAALGELAAVVAHEVRNPVAVVFNALSSLRKILKPTGDAAMLLGIVGEEADRLNRIVGDLLDFARPNEPAIETEPLHSVIADSLEAAVSQPQAGSVEIRTVVSPDLPPVRIDARMLRQALLNVLLNGLQAMPKGGTLTVRAAHERGPDRSYARVDVIDTGTGIPPDVASKIFQPFFTTKATGTGLGLAVVKRIMEAHQGFITVDSQVGAGTTVSLRLPIDEAETATPT